MFLHGCPGGRFPTYPRGEKGKFHSAASQVKDAEPIPVELPAVPTRRGNVRVMQEFREFFATGRDLAAEWAAEDAEKERQRVQAVLAQSMPGHEALVNALAFDGKTTGPEAAAAVIRAIKNRDPGGSNAE